MTVIGVNAYAHDAGVALVRNGEPVFVLEEERLDRVRKSRAFPSRSLALLLERHQHAFDEARAIAFPWRGDRFAWTVAKLIARRFPAALNLLRTEASPNMNFPTALRFLRIPREVARTVGGKVQVPVTFVPHHDAHAASAFFLSPFDKAAVLVMDGFGDECSTSIYHATGAAIRRISTNRFFDSVGIMYSMLTKYLGFRTILDEGKVMALATYGSDELCADLKRMVTLLPNGRYEINERFFGYHRRGELEPVSKEFVRRFGPARRSEDPIAQRHMDIARALQVTLEETVLHVARHVRRELGESALCMAGGTALNCIVNQRVLEETGFEQMYVPPNPNDAGVALGAALAIAHRGARRREVIGPVSPFLGPAYDDAAIDRALKGSGLVVQANGDIVQTAARLLSHGKLIAWFQGAAEMGPRSLGNRSILGDPRDPFLPERLNREVKRREYFRPYAPAVLAERTQDIFEGTVPPSPYMSFAPRVRPSFRKVLPAIVSRDGTARLQTVTREGSSLFHSLLSAFATATGVPALLNTSFNCQEPTVCTPEDAVRTFLHSGLDWLVIGSRAVSRMATDVDVHTATPQGSALADRSSA
jgi:carbamoyltransferase